MSRWLFFLAFFFILALVSPTPTRSCLDSCTCEQDESTPLIRCENGERTSLQLPNNPMSGYEIIAAPCNDLRSLPSYEMIQAAFPDLKGIDVEGNPNLDCTEISALSEHILVKSDCGKSPYVCHKTEEESCDWKCRNLKKILELWEQLKKKLSEFKDNVGQKIKDMDLDKRVKNVGSWFHTTFNKIKDAVKE